MTYQWESLIERAYHQGYEARSKHLAEERDESNPHKMAEYRQAWFEGWACKERTADKAWWMTLSEFLGKDSGLETEALVPAVYPRRHN